MHAQQSLGIFSPLTIVSLNLPLTGLSVSIARLTARPATHDHLQRNRRRIDVLSSQGRAIADAIRAIGVTEVTYYRWRNEYGGLKGNQVKRLKELEAENSRLRRAVSDLTLDKQILREAAKGNF